MVRCWPICGNCLIIEILIPCEKKKKKKNAGIEISPALNPHTYALGEFRVCGVCWSGIPSVDILLNVFALERKQFLSRYSATSNLKEEGGGMSQNNWCRQISYSTCRHQHDINMSFFFLAGQPGCYLFNVFNWLLSKPRANQVVWPYLNFVGDKLHFL